ncbi:hypothetical protein AAIG33_26975, partial [Phytobacter ursingii]|uniref:hypothetical protein n=1 Tax=Phytobacter ursingii TaxID=1972431 RepID=UPI0031B791EA
TVKTQSRLSITPDNNAHNPFSRHYCRENVSLFFFSLYIFLHRRANDSPHFPLLWNILRMHK